MKFASSQGDIDSLLARNFVGRLAFSFQGEIEILPIHYVYAGGSIYGRTSQGSTIGQMAETASKVALEVDEVYSAWNWRSVVVHGNLQLLSERAESESWVTSLGLLRRLSPTTLRNEDRAPHRTELFCIYTEQITGRALGCSLVAQARGAAPVWEVIHDAGAAGRACRSPH